MEQLNHELYENARRRIKQKRSVYLHFILFAVGSLFMFVAEKLFNVGVGYPNWSNWLIAGWAFLFILHFINVFITKRFMNKQWEREEIDRLVEKQKRRLEQLEKKAEERVQKELSKSSNLDS
ncbi:MAG: 2TM domain-containing protein [Bacteroidota bacterium]|nr:2TM domain-containing protein [Bacteroidota bacterium]